MRLSGKKGTVVLLCNKDGVAIHHRGDETRADDFKRWGIWLGAFGLNKLRAQTESDLHHRTTPCWSIADNTTVRATAN